MNEALSLGMTVKDRITGFTGVITGRVNYITGCNQALVAPAVGPDGSLRQSEWFDEVRLQRVHDEIVTLDVGPAPGFDRAPPRR